MANETAESALLEIMHTALDMEHKADDVRSCQSCIKANVCAFYETYCNTTEQVLLLSKLVWTDRRIAYDVHKRFSNLMWIVGGMSCTYYNQGESKYVQRLNKRIAETTTKTN